RRGGDLGPGRALPAGFPGRHPGRPAAGRQPRLPDRRTGTVRAARSRARRAAAARRTAPGRGRRGRRGQRRCDSGRRWRRRACTEARPRGQGAGGAARRRGARAATRTRRRPARAGPRIHPGAGRGAPPMNRRGRLWLLPVSVLAALVLGLLPLPAMVQGLRPYWLALVVAYWVIEEPERAGLGLAFAAGLLADLTFGALLGEQALGRKSGV